MKRVKELRNKLLPHLPTGELIPGIEKNSIMLYQGDAERDAKLVRVELVLFIFEKDIEGFNQLHVINTDQ